MDVKFNGIKMLRGFINPKHEIRAKHPVGINSKQIRMTKITKFPN